MESAITLTEEILTQAQEITNRGLQNANGHTVLEVGLILAIAQLIVTIDNSTGRLVRSMY
jgi:hypothetical protein